MRQEARSRFASYKCARARKLLDPRSGILTSFPSFVSGYSSSSRSSAEMKGSLAICLLVLRTPCEHGSVTVVWVPAPTVAPRFRSSSMARTGGAGISVVSSFIFGILLIGFDRLAFDVLGAKRLGVGEQFEQALAALFWRHVFERIRRHGTLGRASPSAAVQRFGRD